LGAELPTLQETVGLSQTGWVGAFVLTDEPLAFERVPFDHPRPDEPPPHARHTKIGVYAAAPVG
jgi:hypothetical protein